MFKNPSPTLVSFITAISAAVVFVLFQFLYNRFSGDVYSVLHYAVDFFVLLIIAYLSAYFIVKHFVRRRIKLIYKSIAKQKLTSLEKNNPEIYSDNINKVEKLVEQWADQNNREIETLRELEEYRRNYIGNVSHELMTPIFNIQGYIYTLLDGAVNDEEKKFYYLKRAATNVDRLENIVSKLEIISKLESGHIVLNIEIFDIKELVNEVLHDNEMLALRKSIILSFKPGSDHSYLVKADRENIRIVLNNFIQNSIKYGHKTGKTSIGIYDMETNVLVEITDNGIGIPEEHIRHVFDRFYRVDKGRSRAEGGSGLGLSIVKHIIEAHHQTINVRSTPGVGSTFGFTLEKA
ncbi:MAG TPA: ATP-binding protein [Saprospiraceae bacterium]|nr:sensor histidine kinase [Saprospiraceae bacterium]HMV24382.1 ATP-binding protein [Saprospiraceae bacterium]HMX86410.1 ATP-binding protein [Saprospiraceae bacterium]HMZ74413.1 ATP-binding protein [Saprospiraceae bacterium]HNA41066.1 ATP-binding protein [Saprospiraceae bacterium]